MTLEQTPQDVPFIRKRKISAATQREDIEAFRDSVVLWPHNNYWQMLVIISITIHICFVLYNVGFSAGERVLFVYLFDLLFFSDWFLNLLHLCHPEKRNILESPRKVWKMVIEFFSIVPFEMIDYHGELNRGLRVVRIIEYFQNHMHNIGTWPVLNKMMELIITLLLLSSSLTFIIFNYTCKNLDEDNCISLILKFGDAENFTWDHGKFYWYLKTQNVILVELANGGFNRKKMQHNQNLPDLLLIISLLILRLMFLLLFIMPCMTTAFCELRQNKFYVSNFMHILKASLHVNNKINSLPKFTDFYRSMIWSRSVPENWDNMKPLPTSVQQEMNMNAHWNLVRRSGLFKDADLTTRRQIALIAKSWMLPPGSTVFEEGKPHSRMVHVVSGTVIVRQRKRRGESHLGPGSCLGGVNLLYECPSAFTVECLTFCEFDYIDKEAFEKLIDENSAVRQHCYAEMCFRITVARGVSGVSDVISSSEFGDLMPPLAWLEQRYYELHHGAPDTTQKGLEKRFYLDRFLDEYTFIPQRKLTCCQRALKPGSTFLKVWRNISTAVILLAAFVFPYLSCRLYRHSMYFYTFTLVLLFSYLMDLIVSLFTTTEYVYGLKALLKHRIRILSKDWVFYVDIISIVPVWFLFVESLNIRHHEIAIATFLHALKLCKLPRHMRESKRESLETMFTWNTIRFLMVLLYPLWIITVVIYAISCDSDKCLKTEWESGINTVMTPHMTNMISFMCSCETGVSFFTIPSGNTQFHLYIVAAMIVFCTSFVYLFSDVTSNFMMIRSHIYNFELFSKNIFRKMKKRPVSEYLKMRVRKCIQSIGYISDYELQAYKRETLRYLPQMLSHDLLKSETMNVLKKLPLFRNAHDKFLDEIANAMEIHILPPGEVVVNAGQHSAHFFIIQEGLCECLSRSYQKNIILGKYDVISFIEVMGRFPALSSVKCLTFCRIMALEYYVFQNILAKYNEVTQDFNSILHSLLNKNNIQDKIKNELKLIESEPKIESEDLRAKMFLKSWSRTSWKPNSNFLKQISKVFLLNFVILPHGKLLVYMEVVRMILSVISALMFSIRIPLGLYFPGKTEFIYWCIRILDVPAYIDIIFRFHHAYHDERGILITHPFKIALHYLTRSFFTDIIACFPVNLFYHPSHSESKFNLLQGLIACNRSLQLYRIVRLPKLLKILNIKISLLWAMIVFSVLCVVLSSCSIQYLLLRNCENFEDLLSCYNAYNSIAEDGRLSYLYAHVYLLMWLNTALGNIGCYGMVTLGNTKLALCGLTLFGLGLRIVIYSAFTACFVKLNDSAIEYRRDTKRVVRFMKDGKCNEQMKSNVMDFYYMHWMQTRNIEIIPLFRTLHPSLSMDVLFSMFAKTLRKSQIFHDLGDDSIRILLPKVNFTCFPKSSPIVKYNTISDLIYIVLKGSVVVMGADQQVLSIQEVGTMFGNVQKIKWLRLKYSIIAMDDVEILRIKTLTFYERLQIFPQFEVLMQLYKQHNGDYIPAVLPPTERRVSFADFAEDWRSGTRDHHAQHHVAFAQRSRKQTYFRSLFLSPTGKGCLILRSIGRQTALTVYLMAFLGIFYVEPPRYTTVTVYWCDFIHLIVMVHKSMRHYYDDVGELITNPLTIRKHYFLSREFFLDVLSLIPVDFFFFIFMPQYSAIFRINRCLRIMDVYKYLNSKQHQYNTNILVITLLYNFLVIFTVLLPVASLNTIIRPTEERNTNHLLDGLYSGLRLYALASLHCKEIRNLSVLTFYYISRLITHMLWIFTIVCWCGLLRSFQLSLEEYSRRARVMNHYLQSRDVPKYLVEEAWTFSRFLWHDCRGKVEPRLVAKSPRAIRRRLRLQMYGKIVRSHGYYKLHRDFFNRMMGANEQLMFFPGNLIAIAGISDNSTYFISWGIVDEIVEDLNTNLRKNRTLKDGEVFGIKQGVFPNTPHHYTYRARTKCCILMLKYDTWCHFLDFFPAVKHEMYRSSSSLYILDLT